MMTGYTTVARTGALRSSAVMHVMQQMHNSNKIGNVRQITIVTLLEGSDVFVEFILLILLA